MSKPRVPIRRRTRPIEADHQRSCEISHEATYATRRMIDFFPELFFELKAGSFEMISDDVYERFEISYLAVNLDEMWDKARHVIEERCYRDLITLPHDV